MTEIVAGKYITNELSKNANGGTEQMAKRMVNYLPSSLLEDFQIIHSRVRELEPGLKKILVCHDLHNDPEVQNLADTKYRKQFDKIVFVSNWQAQLYSLTMGIPYSEFTVIPNAIEPFEQKEKDFSGPIKLIYHTTPHRGLHIAVAVADALAKHIDVHFDVYSSFSVYGWEQRDEPYKKLFDQINDHPNMTYHGGKTNREVRSALENAHMFLYPSIWPETSCLAAIESLCAGVMPIVPNLAALPETVEHSGVMYQFHENENHHASEAFKWAHGYATFIKNNEKGANNVALNLQQRYNQVYNWNTAQQSWTALLEGLKNGTSSG